MRLKAMTMAIANDAVVRHQPGGPFQIEHFWNADDKRTHIDRINPLDGKSPSDGTGAHGVYSAGVEGRERSDCRSH